MRAFLLAAVLTGCGFAGAPGAPDPGVPDPTDDSSTSDDGTPAAISAYCADPRIVLCLEFDEILTSGVIHDGTVFEQTVIAEQFGGYVHDGGTVLAINDNSVIEVAGNDTLDVREGFTVEAWGNLAFLPLDGPGGDDDSATLIAAEGQFELSLMHDGNVKCAVGDKDVKAGPGRIGSGAWHHYACSWDGTEIALYIDGIQVKRGAPPDLVFEDLPGNVLIGAELDDGERDDPFVGAIDDVRVFMEALPSAEICPGGCL